MVMSFEDSTNALPKILGVQIGLRSWFHPISPPEIGCCTWVEYWLNKGIVEMVKSKGECRFIEMTLKW